MDKLLFYSNKWEDFTDFIKYIEPLEREGFEVAVATDNADFIRPLSMGKLLLVNPKTYFHTVLVSDNPVIKANLTIKEFKELFQ